MMRIFAAIQVFLLINSAQAFPNGAPLSQCGSMFPQHHGAMPITTSNPFSLEVTLNGDNTLNGIFIFNKK